MSFIRFQNVTREYNVGSNVIKALNNVNLEIRQGDFTVILGPSGSGKSTFLNLLGGMDYVTRGEIYVGENNISKFTNKERTLYRRKDIGFVFQFYNLISNLTALDNVQFASSYVENSLDAKETLNKVGLKERYYNFPSQLSGGEQQRVAIARAVAKNPLILLCDEPTGALDSVTGREVLQLLYDINQNSKKTIFIITHNAEIAKIADKVIQIKNGKLDKLYKNDIKVAIDELEW